MQHTLLNLRPLSSQSPRLPPPSPCLTSNFLFCSPPYSTSLSHSLRPTRRFHFLTAYSSLKQSRKQQTLQKSSAPQSLKWFLSPKGDDDDDDKRRGDGEAAGNLEGDTAIKGTLLTGVLLVGVIGGFAGAGYFYKDQINAFLNQFSGFCFSFASPFS